MARPRQRPVRCGTCGQPLTKDPVRICADCKQPILRGHKWKIVKHRLVHRHCKYPNSYQTPADYKRDHGVELFNRMMGTNAFRGY